MEQAQLGTLIHGTMVSKDLAEAFASELERLDPAEYQRQLGLGAPDENQEWVEEEWDQWVEDLMESLNGCAPPYAYFGAHPGDGSDFGFWLSEDVAQLVEEDGCPVVSDLAELPPYVLVINDHGNATLYELTTGREIWGVV